MEKERINAALQRAREYIDALTVDSPVNDPGEVVPYEGRFFTWDNEHRAPSREPYLFQWSYYNGVVMKGLLDLRDAGAGERYADYVRRYLDAMVVTGEDGRHALSPRLAGYVDCHGADCCMTASVLARLPGEWDARGEICRDIYRDLTDATYVNSTGHVVPVEYTHPSLGGNYWHTWAKDKPPKYRVWLDGIYMLQPFLTRMALERDDGEQLERVDRRLAWAANELLAQNGLYFHAGNGAGDVCPFHWTRSMGWYGMAMADVAELLPERYIPARREALRTFASGVLKYQTPSGLWNNLTDRPASPTNRPETSGSAMIAYTLLKAVRLGLLEAPFRAPALRAFEAIVDTKLLDGRLTDIYLRASANGTNNYEKPDRYLPNEGKGVGPFIMACGEIMRI